MKLLMTAPKVQKMLAENTRLKRLEMILTQERLANHSGVPLPTSRKFEQKDMTFSGVVFEIVDGARYIRAESWTQRSRHRLHIPSINKILVNKTPTCKIGQIK